MKQRSIRLRLDDIIDAIDGILTKVEGMDFATYSQSWQARRAIERGTEIISEATRHLPEQWLAEYRPFHGWRSRPSAIASDMSTGVSMTRSCGTLPTNRCGNCGRRSSRCTNGSPT